MAGQSGGSHTLLGLVDELDAVLEELAGHVEDLLHLVGHCELLYWLLEEKKSNRVVRREMRRGREEDRSGGGLKSGECRECRKKSRS